MLSEIWSNLVLDYESVVAVNEVCHPEDYNEFWVTKQNFTISVSDCEEFERDLLHKNALTLEKIPAGYLPPSYHFGKYHRGLKYRKDPW